MSNESYAAQKAARAIGTNSIDNAARICHSPSTFALKEAVGVAATTCSYSDWIGTDLIVFVGSNVANNQPVTTKYLHLAKKAGTKVAVVNPYREPGMERYWIPSNPESALFGTKIADRFFTLNTGGDLGFLTGAMKHLIEADLVNRPFIDAHTVGFEQLRERAEAASWDDLEAVAGTTRAEMADFAEMLGAARRGVLVWSMGITQHAFGEDNVRAVVNLGLARGWVGEEGTGLMPIRGHSGVQGGAEMGCYSTAFPGGAAINAENAAELGDRWGFEVPAEEGMVAPEMIDAAARGELDLLFASGGNFIDVLPDPDAVSETLGRIPTRVHMDIVASSQMLVDPPEGGEVLILPATTRYENPGGVTETTTERRVVLSPGDPGTADRRGEGGVGGLRRPRRAGAARAGRSCASRERRRSGRRSGRSFPATPRSPSCARAATPSSTGALTCRAAPPSRPRTARRTSRSSTFPTRSPPTAASPSPRVAASSSTRWSRSGRTRSTGRCANRC